MPNIRKNLKRNYQTKKALKILERSPYFRDLNLEDRKKVQDQQIVEYQAGDVLIKQGDNRAPALFILIEGELQVSKRNGDKHFNLAKLTPGQIFGESSIVSGLSSSATVTAISPSLAYQIKRETLISLMRQLPSFGAHLVKVFRERVYFNIETMISAWRNQILDPEASSVEDAVDHALTKNIIRSKTKTEN